MLIKELGLGVVPKKIVLDLFLGTSRGGVEYVPRAAPGVPDHRIVFLHIIHCGNTGSGVPFIIVITKCVNGVLDEIGGSGSSVVVHDQDALFDKCC